MTTLTELKQQRAELFRIKDWWLAATLLVIAVGVLAWPWLSGVVTIPWDAKAHHYAHIQFLARSLHAGDSPFWTPNIFAGSPQVADPQSMIFSPPFFLLAWFNSDPGFVAADAIVFAMLALAGLAALMFFKDKGWSPTGGLVAGISIAFGGSSFWRLQHIGEVLSLCWFLIALWLLNRALERRSFVWGLAAGVISGFMVVGRDQIALLCAYVLAAVVIGSVFKTRDIFPNIKAAVAAVAGGFIGGVLTATVPIAMSLALAVQSNRPAIDFDEAARGGLHPAALLTAFVANLYGTDGPNSDFWGPPVSTVWGASNYILARNMGDIYFGALPAIALLAMIVTPRGLLRREICVFAICALLMGFFAFGGYAPFFRLMYLLPGIDLYRRPADATFPLGALFSLLGGYSVHLIVTQGARVGLKPIGIVAPTLLILATCAGLAWYVGRLSQAEGALLTALLFSGLAIGLLVIASERGRLNPTLVLIAVSAFMIWDLGVSNRPNESTALPPQTYDMLRPDTRNDTVVTLKRFLAANQSADRRDRVEVAGIDFQWPNLGLVHDFDHDLGYNPIRLELFEAATHANDTVAIPEQRVFSPLFPSYHSPMANLFGLRFIATGIPIEQIDRTLKPGMLRFIGRASESYIYENPDALPRVVLATQAMRVNFEQLLQKGGLPDLDYRNVVLLDQSTLASTSQPTAMIGTAKLKAYRNTEILIEADVPESGGWVVLHDIWHPWWVARVDGKVAPIERANVIFRAVRVEAGRHTVEFEFKPFAGLWSDAMSAFKTLLKRQPIPAHVPP